MELRPQRGPQEKFLASPADICIYGGAAGCGKTYGLLLEPIRHLHVMGFNPVFFRRTTPQLRNPGAAWDESSEIYPYIGGIPYESSLVWKFRQWGTRIEMTHMESEQNRYDHDGAQYPLELWDELIHFTEKQFWYLVGRNRTMCGIRPYIRAATNPDSKSWVRQLIDWWIQPDGYPSLQRAGVLRWFTRIDGRVCWVDGDWKADDGSGPKSITFIPGRLQDNPALVSKNPEYVNTLNSLPRVDRLRLKEGNWNVSEEEGMFEASWFPVVDSAPRNIRLIRYWDRAATEVTDKNKDPDWTAGALCGMYDGELYICDMQHFRESPHENEKRIKHCAGVDGNSITIGIEQEPGSSGKDTTAHYQTRVLQGHTVKIDKPTGSKVDRCKPWCALAEQGHVRLVRGQWNRNFLDEAASFPHGKKDQIDAVSGAYTLLSKPVPKIYSTQESRNENTVEAEA